MNMQQIRDVIDRDKDQLIADIRELVAVPSVGGPAEAGAPFGKGPRAALDKFVEMGKRMNFRTWAFDDQVGIAEMGDEDLPEMIAALCHVDVVPAGDGWTCDPWKGKIEIGMLYGRGVADDKGPAVSVLYAMKALRECGVTLKRRFRLIVGTNEELGSRAIDHYVKSGQELPVMGFTPDAEYPLINGEKGIFTVRCRAPFKADGGSVQVLSIDAGVAANAVPSSAVAVLKVSPDARPRLNRVLGDFAAPRSAKLTCEKIADDQFRLTMEGLSFHGSTPQFGSNAAANLVKVLRLLGIGGEQGAFFDTIDGVIGDQTRGENLGLMLYDDISGFTSLCWGLLKSEPDGRIMFSVNYRYPVTFDRDEVLDRFVKALRAHGFEFDVPTGGHPLYIPEDDPLVQKLMSVYRQETGDTESKPFAIGGGTYAKEMPNMVAFGNAMPGEQTHIHELDERWSMESIVKNAKIMAAAIAALAGVEE